MTTEQTNHLIITGVSYGHALIKNAFLLEFAIVIRSLQHRIHRRPGLLGITKLHHGFQLKEKSKTITVKNISRNHKINSPHYLSIPRSLILKSCPPCTAWSICSGSLSVPTRLPDLLPRRTSPSLAGRSRRIQLTWRSTSN